MPVPIHLPPTQQRILALLRDGLLHDREEVRACLPDELSGLDAVRYHVSELRAVLRLRGLDIVARSGCYQLVRLLPSPLDE